MKARSMAALPLLGLGGLLLPGVLRADTLNLTGADIGVITDPDYSPAVESGLINGAFFSKTEVQPAGSGVIYSFVRLGPTNANETNIEGHNTSARPVGYDENTSATFTRPLLASSLVSQVVEGVESYAFLLDINQKNSDPLLSLNDVQIFGAATGDLVGTESQGLFSLGATASSIYDMDVGTPDWTVELAYTESSAGSGRADMFLYVPKALFTGKGDYIYLYSYFGNYNGNNDGYEEWATLAVDDDEPGPGPLVPLPPVLLGGALLMGMIGVRRAR